jgi:hypothetical protein
MPAAVHTPIHPGAPRQVPVVASREVPRAAGRGGVVNVSRAGTLRWHTPLEDGLWLVAVAWSVPVAVLALGIPIALAIVLLLWAGRAALGAF